MYPDNIEAVKLFGLRHRFKVCTGGRYFGAFIGYNESKHDWLEERTKTWEQNITKIGKTVVKHPQGSYTAVVPSIQLERIFLQCVTKNTVDAFAGVEKILQKNFLPRLFFRK